MLTAASARARYIGVDLARLVAIIGMMTAHLVAIQADLPAATDFERTLGDITESITAGTAASLFAVLGGLSIVFATRRFVRDGRLPAAIGSVAVRGVMLLLIGLLLGLLESNIVVVLAYYGVAMLLVAPLVGLRSWILAAIAAVIGLAGGVVNAHTRQTLAVTFEGHSVSFELLFQDPGTALRALALTGIYPAVTWVVYLIVGILIGRALTSATARGALGRTSLIFAGCGLTLAATAQIVTLWLLAHLSSVGIFSSTLTQEQLAPAIMDTNYGAPIATLPWLQLIAVPHTGSIGDLVRTIGISFAVIGLLVWLCDRERVASRTVGLVLSMFRAAGAAPLTIYTLHVLVTGMLYMPYTLDPSLWITAPPPWWIVGPGALALQLAGALALGAVLSATGLRGPLEALLSKIVAISIPTKTAPDLARV